MFWKKSSLDEGDDAKDDANLGGRDPIMERILEALFGPCLVSLLQAEVPFFMLTLLLGTAGAA